MPRIKFSAEELRKRVDEVLYYVWDPIGVAREPCARNEYTSYVLQVLRIVEESDDPRPISELLSKIASETMSLTPDKIICYQTAELLIEHKNAIRKGYA